MKPGKLNQRLQSQEHHAKEWLRHHSENMYRSGKFTFKTWNPQFLPPYASTRKMANRLSSYPREVIGSCFFFFFFEESFGSHPKDMTKRFWYLEVPKEMTKLFTLDHSTVNPTSHTHSSTSCIFSLVWINRRHHQACEKNNETDKETPRK